MEIPQKLQDLYRHWEHHTQPIPFSNSEALDQKILAEMESFMVERMQIWEKKVFQQTPPHTQDKVLQKFRFCNIYRELDKQTIEIHEHLEDLRSNFPLWLLNLAFHRFVCNPTTVKKVGLLNFLHKNNEQVYENLMELERPKYGTAYIFPISTIQRSECPTREEFFCFYLPSVMKKITSAVEKFKNTTVLEALDTVFPLFGFNLKFHWTEILIDVAYQFPQLINLYKDFPIGPGSLPTMKRLNNKLNPTETCNLLAHHRPKDFPYLTYKGKKVLLSAENWEGVGCEFRKYTNLGQGRGRIRKYH
ncbi:hypothetical protein A2886_00085 [candidate division WWE3 bacterium RIFCSPHIGHO2_01_FULL_42_13]|uniref:5-hmdU DNA kinase helical domain-containing protein n=1 Tax=candidate division WWE3 bacterium RIFCSPHIGHO2_01_FULL_42_13 TaxID=1802617 RepID=A0A1F4URA6_UNCKA|nr:MAG: hypothetical protein A2886_00085 [candidate division WWE3 bacterium RIFCSPHIGHO2_01_FULL_42_13]